jgi:hypothetical protein
MPDAQVNWYEDDVILVVDQATDDFVSRIAFHVEGEAKVGAPVDTGFMWNAIYAITPAGSNRGRAVASARGAAADRDLASEPGIGEGEAAVHAAAEYTIFQEMRRGFLYRALERAQAVAGGMIEAAGKEHFGG